MKCPVCRTELLHATTIEGGLPVGTCYNCGGNWLSSDDYQQWLNDQDDPGAQRDDERPLPVSDTSKAKLCPECGHILIKYKVGHDIDFTLDHCGNCNGVWFDQNEWEVLLRRGLHDGLHRVFDEEWQNSLLREEIWQQQKERYRQRLGEDDFAELRRLKRWIDQHPERDMILAYLNRDLSGLEEETGLPPQ